MHAMEEGLGSAEPSGGVVKKKCSSGCLIIKRKGDGNVGFGASTSKKGIELSKKKKKKKKKRPRLILSDSDLDSESSDELEPPYQRKIASKSNKIGNGSVVRKEGLVKDNSSNNKPEIESERKRSGLDVFEFDEYDDVKKIKKDDRVGQSGNKRESLIGSSSRNIMVDKIKNPFVDGKSSISGKSKELIYPKKKHEKEDDEANLTLSSLREKYREACDEPIRLQGKNGVLKVMVNKQKKTGLNHKSHNHQESEGRKGSRSEHAAKTSVTIRPLFHSDSKRTEKKVSFVKTEKIELKSQKSASTKTGKVKDSEKVDIDKPRKLGSASTQACNSTKTVKKEGKTTPITEKTAPIKRSAGTEKQKLREKVRSMLLDAGWTIDYRPRRNRDYLDAVYINPNGSAYWSIVKAYDALQKQLEEEDLDNIKKESSESSPLPEEILSKLTRQTQKKMEREMKKRSREDSEEKLSFYMKRNHKSKKRSHDDRVEKSMVERGRCTLLVRSSKKGVNSEEDDGFVPYTGKRTILAWLIDSGTVRMSEKVQYMNRRKTRTMLEGWVTREGIHCGCCSKILTVLKFEIHAGSKQRQPFSNIFVESGISLLQCQIEAWNKQEGGKREGFHRVDVDGDDPNDDTCGLCGDGGDLICCDGCPSTFHQSCLDIEILPQGEWHCPNCTCKFCGIGGGGTAEANGTSVSALFTCSLCEKKYHEACCQEIDDIPNSDNPTTFCGGTCRKLFGQLRKLLGVKHELEEGYSWSIIHRMDPSSSSDTVHLQRVECNSKLAVALSIMDECFLPIVDRRSEINIIQSVLYNCGSNFDRLNYSSFYTVILERGDEIICAASIRIRGTRLAEMPFIGTRHMYRRKGMCRRLFSAIESVLCSLKVEKLIIPAITEHMHTWTEAFNFNPLEELHKQEMRSFNMLVFPGIDMLQKQLVKSDMPEENITTNSDTKTPELGENHPPSPMPGKDTELDSSNGNELQHRDETKLRFPSEETIAVNAPSESDADMKCPTPSNRSPVNLEISTHVLDPPVTDKSYDAQEVSDEASCVGFVLDKTAEANENLNPVSVSTVTCAENSDLNRQSAVEVQTESAPAEGSKGEICEEGVEIACAGTEPVSLLEISASNSTENVHEIKSAISCSLPEGMTEPIQPILDGDDHEGTDEGMLQLGSELNTANVREAGCEVPLVLECGSEAKVAEVNVKVAHIEVDVSINDTAEEMVENPTPTLEMNDSNGNVQNKSVSDRHSAVEMGSEVHVTTEVALSNGVH